MRIWLQSAASVGHDIKYKLYEESLKRNIRKVVREDTVVDVRGVKAFPFDMSPCYYFEHLNTSQILENGLQAEKEGYDAFAINCSLEPGYYELRQILDIPVFSVTATVLHVACLLGDKFSVIAHIKEYKMRIEQLIKRYELEEKSAGTGLFATPAPVAGIARDFENPKASAAVEAFISEAEKAVERGAEVVIPLDGVLNRLVLDAGITQVKGAPVLPTVEIFIKCVEMMVDLQQKAGVSISRLLLYAQPGKERLKEARKAYGVG
ncbi:aspartate/glutamate racemase family protein [Chloroflexota bacterium]